MKKKIVIIKIHTNEVINVPALEFDGYHKSSVAVIPNDMEANSSIFAFFSLFRLDIVRNVVEKFALALTKKSPVMLPFF